MELPHRIALPPTSTPPSSIADTRMLSQPVLTPSAEDYHTDTSPSLEAHPHLNDNEGWMTPQETLLDAVDCSRRDNQKGWWETEGSFQKRIAALKRDRKDLIKENKKLRGERDMAKHAKVAADNRIGIAIKKKNATVNERNAAINEKEAATKEMNIAIKEKNAAVNRKNAAIDEKNAAIDEKDAAIDEKNAATKEMNIAIEEKNAAIDEKNAAIDEKNAAIKEMNMVISAKNTAIGEKNAAVSKKNMLKDRNNTLRFQIRSAKSESRRLRMKASALRKEIVIAINKKNTAIRERHSQSRERDRLGRELAGVRDTLANRDSELNLLRQTRETLEVENARLHESLRLFESSTRASHRRDSQQSGTGFKHDWSAVRNTETFDNGRSIQGDRPRRRKTRRRHEGGES